MYNVDYMAFLDKIFNSFKKKKYVFLIIIIILIISGILFFNNKKSIEQTIVINHTDFINKVSVSGKVIASQDVDLSFKNEGRVEHIYFSVGQKVNEGALIAKIDATNAEKTVQDAELNLESAKIALEKLKIEKSNENISADEVLAYDDGFNTVSDTFIDLSTILNDLYNILGENNLSDNDARLEGTTAQNYRSLAETTYYDAKNSFEETRKFYRTLNQDSSKEDIEKIISDTYETTKIFSEAIKNLLNFVDYMSEHSDDSLSFNSSQNTLATNTVIINTHLADLLSVETNINDNKDSFQNADLDIQSAELTIKQKENVLQDVKAKLSDYFIRAPFLGVITRIDAKIGEIANSNVPLITMMSEDIFQIESYVPEVNIAQINLGDEANVTLDAYGESVLFNAKVISIDPAETIRDGVSTYKVKFQFKEKDDRIKSGMTASVTIITFSKPNTIVVPGGVIFDKEGKKFLKVKVDEKILEKEVVLGITSSLGQVEIVSGLSDGDIVILNPEKK